MSGEAGGAAVLLVGLLLVRLSVTDLYQRYVQVAMGPWLLAAGVLLIGLGVVALALGIRSHRPQTVHEAHHHDRVGWLLLVPVLALLLAPPPALGSFGVNRGTPRVSITGGGHTYEALPAGDPHVMTLREFDERAMDQDGRTLAGRTVELTGFVAVSDGGGFQLARYQIACCAADAVAALVRVVDTGPAPARDSWVTVTGVFRGGGRDGVPELASLRTRAEPAPVNPYE